MPPPVAQSSHDAPSPGGGERISRWWLGLCALVITICYGLLWSPNWYPLSDSALYLAMGRSWAAGRGLTVQGHAVDLVPSIVPLLFGLIMKGGGGIGAIQGVLIAFLLLAHALAFAALRSWVGERLALAATIAGAASYWIFYNACTLMTEPVAMAFTWAGLWSLAGAKLERPRGWARAALAGAFFLLAAQSRDAAILLLPGAAVVMWAQNRRSSWRAHALWGLVVLAMLTVLLWNRAAAKYQLRGDRDPFLVEKPAGRPAAEEEHPDANAPDTLRPARLRMLYGVPRNWRLLTHPPMLLGRWAIESLAGGTFIIFKSRNPAIWALGYLFGLLGAIVLLSGTWWWWRRGGWWCAIPLLYLLPIWGQWGARLKPRYMGLVAPMLLLVLAGGLAAVLSRLGRRSERNRRPSPDRLYAGKIAMVLAGLVVVANLPAWAGEVYIRRQRSRDFYDIARRGASAELVDIAAYLQAHADADAVIWFNRGAERRVAHFLVGRRVLVRDVALRSWSDAAAIEQYLARIPAGDRWAILYVDEPAPGYTWPRWHWPFAAPAAHPRFYMLMRRDADGRWRPVQTAAKRAYVRSIPPSSV